VPVTAKCTEPASVPSVLLSARSSVAGSANFSVCSWKVNAGDPRLHPCHATPYGSREKCTDVAVPNVPSRPEPLLKQQLGGMSAWDIRAFRVPSGLKRSQNVQTVSLARARLAERNHHGNAEVRPASTVSAHLSQPYRWFGQAGTQPMRSAEYRFCTAALKTLLSWANSSIWAA